MPYALPRSNVLTHHMLVLAHACPEQRKMFVELFGYRVKVTQTNLSKASKAGLWLIWFGDHFAQDNAAWQRDLCHFAAKLPQFATQEEDRQALVELVYKHVCWQY